MHVSYRALLPSGTKHSCSAAAIAVVLMAMPFAELLGDVVEAPAKPAKTGTITGRFVVRGKVPPPAFLPAGGAAPPGTVDDSWIVNSKDHSLANMMVLLVGKNIEPKKQPENVRTLVIRKSGLVPRVLCVQRGEALDVRNEDGVNRVLEFPENTAPGFVRLRAGETTRVIMGSRRHGPAVILDGHTRPWPRSVVLVTDHGFAAVSDAEGRFALSEIPVGKWNLRLAHERNMNLPKVWMNGTATELRGSLLPIEVHAGDNALGAIEIAIEDLKIE